MSELMFLFGELDRRIRPLMFCVRHWARSTGITYSNPGHWVSNFGLTCLVIFFLQQLSEPILPSLNHLISHSRPEDVRTLESDRISFLRDFNLLTFKTTNTSTLPELLLQFFEFYSNFKFKEKALSLHAAHALDRSDSADMFVVNPMEPHLNVTQNARQRECERMQNGMRIARNVLETEIEKGRNNANEPWGILEMIREFNPFSVVTTTIMQESTLLTENKKAVQRIKNIQSTQTEEFGQNLIQMSAKQDINRLINVPNLYTKSKGISQRANGMLNMQNIYDNNEQMNYDRQQANSNGNRAHKHNNVSNSGNNNNRNGGTKKQTVAQLMMKLKNSLHTEHTINASKDSRGNGITSSKKKKHRKRR